MKTAELQDALLDYWVARAEGHAAEHLEIRSVPRADLRICVRTIPSLLVDKTIALEVMAYSTNWAQCGPLIAKHKLDVQWFEGASKWCSDSMDDLIGGYGSTPLRAICRAVVHAAFGDEVEDLPCA